MYSRKWFWFLISPALLIFTLIIVLPTFLGILLSFTNWKAGEAMFQGGWIGFSNYSQSFKNGSFVSSIGYTSVFTLLSLLLVNIVGFLFALLLTQSFKGRNFFRGVFFLPNLIGGLVLGYLWKQIFNLVFTRLLDIPSMITGESSRWVALFAMTIVITWQMSGYIMVIYVAALQNIPKHLKEVSEIEGASIWKKFTNVTLPSIMPAVTVSLFLVLSNSFKMFDLNLSLLDGWGHDRNLLALDIYKTAFSQDPLFRQTFGIAQAKSVIFTMLVSTISISQVVLTRRFEVDS